MSPAFFIGKDHPIFPDPTGYNALGIFRPIHLPLPRRPELEKQSPVRKLQMTVTLSISLTSMNQGAP